MDVKLATPGETITSDAGFMRGHGTYPMALDEGGSALVAAVPGAVERVNKLVSVRPLRARYGGDIGDVVVGRITEVNLGADSQKTVKPRPTIGVSAVPRLRKSDGRSMSTEDKMPHSIFRLSTCPAEYRWDSTP